MWPERALAIWLGAAGLICASSAVAVVMPLSWHAATHAWLGLGEFPAAPIAEYLARAMSGMCLFYGLLLIYLAQDVRLYAGFLRFQVLTLMALSTCASVLFWQTAMPRWWVIGDVVGVWAFGLGVLGLQLMAGRLPANGETEAAPLEDR